MDFSSFFAYPVQDSDDNDADYIFLPEWDSNNWNKLLKHTQTQLYYRGEIVIQSDDSECSLYIVAVGSLDVLTTSKRKLRRIATIPMGSIVGEQSFLDGKPRSATIRANSDSQIIQLTRESFDIFAAKEPRLARAVLFDLGRILSLRLRSTLEYLSSRQ